jgi:hypothetical protein
MMSRLRWVSKQPLFHAEITAPQELVPPAQTLPIIVLGSSCQPIPDGIWENSAVAKKAIKIAFLWHAFNIANPPCL